MNQTTSPTSAAIALDHLNQLQTTDGTLLMWAEENLTIAIDELTEGATTDGKLIRLLGHALRDLEAARGHIDRATAALSGQSMIEK